MTLLFIFIVTDVYVNVKVEFIYFYIRACCINTQQVLYKVHPMDLIRYMGCTHPIAAPVGLTSGDCGGQFSTPELLVMFKKPV